MRGMENSTENTETFFLDALKWLDDICDLLKIDRCPTTKKMTAVIGQEKPNPNGEIRGSMFLEPFDARFSSACINPILTSSDDDSPIDYLGFHSKLPVFRQTDMVKRFPNCIPVYNAYDEGTQFFFHPVSKEVEFTAVSFFFDTDNNKPQENLIFNNITFHFGDNLTKAFDGYHMKRKI